MKTKLIKTKTILSNVKGKDDWFGLKYNMNLYRGCMHRCIYCDSRSECYRVDNFDTEIEVKENAITLLKKEIVKKRVIGTIGFGSMNDPYMPIEKKYQLVKQALEIIHLYKFPIHIITKSNLVLRDIDIISEINKVSTYAAISFSTSTVDDDLAKKVEPFASSPTKRLEAMGILSELGITTGLIMMPILPFLQDNEKNILDIVTKAKEYGASYIIPSFGVTLRDRQKEYYYNELDKSFPGIREKYENQFKKSYYSYGTKNYNKLNDLFREKCYKLGIKTSIPKYKPNIIEQLSLF